nr:MAG: hypothetical protein DIU78_12160 [Pseudomonadota bacterium]
MSRALIHGVPLATRVVVHENGPLAGFKRISRVASISHGVPLATPHGLAVERPFRGGDASGSAG